MNKNLKANLKILPFFSLESIKPQSKTNILPFLKYQKKKGEILGLKKGVYVSKEFVEREKLKQEFEVYLEFLANKLLEPSYLSLGYVLSKHSLISEAIYELTSITLKTSRRITNDLGIFSYFKIKPSLFCGWRLIKKGNFLIKEATKAKALFDFLYFQKRGLEKINPSFIEELRLNLEEMQKSDWLEFEKYLEISKSKKMKKIFKIIKKELK